MTHDSSRSHELEPEPVELVPLSTSAPADGDVGSMTLGELIDVVVDAHAKVNEAMSAGLINAWRCGEALEAAFALVPRGTWTAWCEANLPFGPASAILYRRLWRARDVLLADLEDGLSHDITSARKRIRGITEVSGRGDTSADTKADARRMYREGVSVSDIADGFGVNEGTVRIWVDPEAAKRAKRSSAEYRERRRRERKALADAERRAEKDALAKTGTENQQNAYLLLRRLLKLVEAESPRLLVAERRLLEVEELILRAINDSEHGKS